MMHHKSTGWTQVTIIFTFEINVCDVFRQAVTLKRKLICMENLQFLQTCQIRELLGRYVGYLVSTQDSATREK